MTLPWGGDSQRMAVSSGFLHGKGISFAAFLAAAALLFSLAVCGCGKQEEEGRTQAEELRSSYAEMRVRMAELEGSFLEMEELLVSSRGEELSEAVLQLVREKRRLYGELVRKLDELMQICADMGIKGGAYATYASMLRELVELNREEAAVLGGLLLVVEDLGKRLPLQDPSELPPFGKRIDDAAARVGELRAALQEGEKRADEEWRRH